MVISIMAVIIACNGSILTQRRLQVEKLEPSQANTLPGFTASQKTLITSTSIVLIINVSYG